MCDEERKEKTGRGEILPLISFSPPELLVTHLRPQPIALLMVMLLTLVLIPYLLFPFRYPREEGLSH
jgi:hypothetical protein